MLTICIKWNKQTFENVEFDPALGVSNLKSVICKLTNVPPERQKLMAKGAWIGTLKDNADLTMLPIKTNHQVMLMGTADVMPVNVNKALFIEDMSKEDLAKTGSISPMGFVNLGNTCYMNSVLQVIRTMPDLRDSLSTLRFNGSLSTLQTQGGDGNLALSCTLRDTLNTLDKSGEKMTPFTLIQLIRVLFPQYAQQMPGGPGGGGGGFMQQDAEEFFNTLTSVFQNSLPSSILPTPNYTSAGDLLQIEFEEQLSCVEEPKEPVIMKHKSELVNKLVCNIKSNVTSTDDNNSNVPAKVANIMIDGIILNMEGTLEKHSDILGRNAIWRKHQRISKLPKYICVQFMRFFWKPTPDSREHAGVKCKIMRPVTFPENFDVYPLCNDALQKQMKINRELELKAKDAKTEEKSKVVEGITNDNNNTNDEMNIEDDEEEVALKAALTMSMQNDETKPPQPPTNNNNNNNNNVFGEHLPSDFTGHYELYGIVTHKGRSADSGHYIGWVRQEKDPDMWWKFDDAVVSEVTTSEIMDLKGGGDWHTAYLNFYRYKKSSSQK
eukprot:TRINITY_DN66035_c7_g2_i1.p1 TRINITY_DN66035_c7_g2~~TRINITY_DN66035_c7_g2_i1.p1  ORF type:complete len:551 (-),score=21.62 TRINITY_DN66035_c7_g2_i1:145-1797(-)